MLYVTSQFGKERTGVTYTCACVSRGTTIEHITRLISPITLSETSFKYLIINSTLLGILQIQ